MEAKEFVKNIILNGTSEEKKELFRFNFQTPKKIIAKKFKLFSRGCYPRYFREKAAPFHDDFVDDMIRSYFGENMLEAAFRGSAKTSLKKLFDVFVLLNDEDSYRKYIKVLSRDLKNSKQIVTDVFNLMVEVRDIYGDVFEKEGDLKREETMTGFTMKNGRKYTAGTVGQTQRGHVQDAYRPDWIWFEDIEDRESIRSIVITQATIGRIGEAIDGLSIDGSYYVTCNYISDQGAVQWFINRPSVKSRITPLLKDSSDNKSATWDVFNEAKVAQIRKDTDDFFGEYQCLKPDTLIYTDVGLREISSLKIGDLVCTHLNRLQKILKVFESEADDLLDITVENKVTTITKNHPVLVLRGKKSVWVKAGDLNLSDLLLKIPRGKLCA